MENCVLPAASLVPKLKFKQQNTQARVVYWFVNWQDCQSTIGTKVNNKPPHHVSTAMHSGTVVLKQEETFQTKSNLKNKMDLTQAQIRQQL